ncbi:MAG: hypothetical protein ACI8Z9_001395, partial [Paraglaciecola sp.]
MKSLKLSPFFTVTAIALGLSISAHAADDRYIIQVEDSKKGVVKALAKKLGGEINV